MESLCTVDGNIKWYSHCGKKFGGSSKKKKLKIGLPYDSTIPLLGTNPKEDICTPMFIVALFIKAKRWKPPKCSLTDEWKNKMYYIHTAAYYSAV